MSPPIPGRPREEEAPEPEVVSPERREQIDAFDVALDEEDHEIWGRTYEEVGAVTDALRGDSDLGELSDAEQAYLLDVTFDRWSNVDPDPHFRTINYTALERLAEEAVQEEALAGPVSEAFARRAVDLENEYNRPPGSLDIQLRTMPATFATHAVTVAGSPEDRRALLEELGPADAATLTGSLASSERWPSSALGGPVYESQKVVAQAQLLEAAALGEPNETSRAIVDTAFATMTPDDLKEQGGFAAAPMAEAIAAHWYPDDATRAASEAERLEGLLTTRQGREYLLDQDVPLAARLDNLARVQQNEDWDRELFTSEDSAYDISEVVFETALPTAIQYRDLRGDEPVTMSGTDLDNTIGFAMGFPPQGIDPDESDADRQAREAAVARGEHSLFAGEPADEVIEPIADAIRDVGGDDAQVTVLPIQYAADGVGTVELPLFRVVDSESGAERFVDNTGRTYDDFDDWRSNNRLPPGNMTYPVDGHIDERATIATRNTPETVDSTGERITNFLDQATLVGGVVAGGAIILGSGGVLAPAVAGGAAAWQVYRSADDLYDRYEHGQSINPLDDSGARAAWLNVGAGAASIVSLGATGVAGRLAASGSRYAATGASAASFLRVGAGVLDTAAAGDAGYALLTNWDDLSGQERASLALSVGFWGVSAAATRASGGGARPYDLEAQRNGLLFGDLDASTVRHLTDELGDDVGAMVARSTRFQEMSAPERRAFIDEFSEDFGNLRGSAGFDDLPPHVREGLVERWPDLDADVRRQFLDADPGHPANRAAIAETVSSEAFSSLAVADQTRLLTLVSGENPQVSGAVRAQLDTLMRSDAWGQMSSSERTQRLREFVNDPEGIEVTYGFDNHARPSDVPSTIGLPTTVGRYGFPSGVAAGERYTIDVHGTQVQVVINATDPPSGQHVPGITEIAESLRRLPPEAVADVDRIVVDSRPNPDDAFWREVYGDDDFYSAMTADTANRTINVYPTLNDTTAGTVASSFAHEIGHFESDTRWGRNHTTGPEWAPWRAAIADDGVAVSQYAKNNPGEDFAETYSVYLDVLGTPREAELRALMPERFAILDEIHGGS